jgi:hypothetical protein
MRRQPIVVRALLALAIAWLAVDASPRGTLAAHGSTVGRAAGDAATLPPPHATVHGVEFPTKASPSDGPGHAVLPSRAIPHWSDAAGAPSAFEHSGIRERASHRLTYDATAPPATPKTVG